MKQWTIYCHIHNESGRRYIGLTSQTWQQRWKNHIDAAKRAKANGRWHFPNAIRKYGKDAFSHEVLEICSTVEEANAAEEKWIKHFDTRNLEKGFNLANGGTHIPHPTKNPWDRPEFRKKMQEKILPKLIEAGNSPSARAKSKAALNTPKGRQALSNGMKTYYSDSKNRIAQSERIKKLHSTNTKFSKLSYSGLEAANQKKSARTHCVNGHEFTEDNTYVTIDGFRGCRKCACIKASKSALKNKTHCSKGHKFIDGFYFLSRDGRRICKKCLPTHCKFGHEYIEENTQINKNGSRSCKECRRIQGRILDSKRRQIKQLHGAVEFVINS